MLCQHEAVVHCINVLYIQAHKHCTCTYHTARAYLVYWEKEDSVSVTRRYDMVEQVSEPAVRDVVKIKFQHQVCEGVLAEVGTPRAMKSKEEAFLRGEVHTLLP